MNPKSLQIRWIDQIVPDTKNTSNFYTDLFGFSQEPVDEGDGVTSYCLNDKDGKNIFGIVDEVNFKDWPHGWVIYFSVEDSEYDEYCEKAESLGAKIIYKSPIQCLLKDPSGAPIVINPEKLITQTCS